MKESPLPDDGAERGMVLELETELKEFIGRPVVRSANGWANEGGRIYLAASWLAQLRGHDRYAQWDRQHMQTGRCSNHQILAATCN